MNQVHLGLHLIGVCVWPFNGYLLVANLQRSWHAGALVGALFLRRHAHETSATPLVDIWVVGRLVAGL